MLWCLCVLVLVPAAQLESLVSHLSSDMASEGIEAKTLTLKLKTTAFEVQMTHVVYNGRHCGLADGTWQFFLFLIVVHVQGMACDCSTSPKHPVSTRTAGLNAPSSLLKSCSGAYWVFGTGAIMACHVWHKDELAT